MGIGSTATAKGIATGMGIITAMGTIDMATLDTVIATVAVVATASHMKRRLIQNQQTGMACHLTKVYQRMWAGRAARSTARSTASGVPHATDHHRAHDQTSRSVATGAHRRCCQR